MEGQKEIEAEFEDVKTVAEAIKDSRVVRNLGKSLERWGKSDEVEHLKELDKKFLASPEGKRLVAEWKDVGECLEDKMEGSYDRPTACHSGTIDWG